MLYILNYAKMVVNIIRSTGWIVTHTLQLFTVLLHRRNMALGVELC